VTQRRLAGHAAVDPMLCSQVLRALEDGGPAASRNCSGA
jgi:hypothetical protein